MRPWRPWSCPYDDLMRQADPKPYWNTNVARHPGILRAVPKTGTASATAAQPLLDYINRRYPLTQTTPLDANRFRANAVPEAEPGDIIAYDWQNDGEVDHLSLVVDIADGQYPEIAEWGVVDWNPLGVINRNATTPYAKRGWTYSEKNHNWLQSVEETRNVSAKLIHIDTRNVTTF
ncbi:hypothetical protein SAVERM_270 [Streptomyces avermitilis MA-4680 = NBRC 14893]|uniref:Putative amidase domain-containing protein n=2 Tax=Streptomyces avermitilis TaxID=33903 RepID=Q82R74_STRAW|nr:hypothetical protein SAVERM_270 [Streptomyces avermitilis MA-4680 = NBRC 14893]